MPQDKATFLQAERDAEEFLNTLKDLKEEISLYKKASEEARQLLGILTLFKEQIEFYTDANKEAKELLGILRPLTQIFVSYQQATLEASELAGLLKPLKDQIQFYQEAAKHAWELTETLDPLQTQVGTYQIACGKLETLSLSLSESVDYIQVTASKHRDLVETMNLDFIKQAVTQWKEQSVSILGQVLQLQDSVQEQDRLMQRNHKDLMEQVKTSISESNERWLNSINETSNRTSHATDTVVQALDKGKRLTLLVVFGCTAVILLAILLGILRI